jgi:hypothetical protein
MTAIDRTTSHGCPSAEPSMPLHASLRASSVAIRIAVLVDPDGHVSVYADQPGVQLRVVDMEPPGDVAPDMPRVRIRGEGWSAEALIHNHDDEIGVDAPFVERIFDGGED